MHLAAEIRDLGFNLRVIAPAEIRLVTRAFQPRPGKPEDVLGVGGIEVKSDAGRVAVFDYPPDQFLAGHKIPPVFDDMFLYLYCSVCAPEFP